MTAGLHNFIVTEMGGLFVCCHGETLLLPGSADFTEHVFQVFVVCMLDLFARQNIALIVFLTSERD